MPHRSPFPDTIELEKPNGEIIVVPSGRWSPQFVGSLLDGIEDQVEAVEVMASVSEAIHQIEHYEIAKMKPQKWRRRAMQRYRDAHHSACERNMQRGSMVFQVMVARGAA